MPTVKECRALAADAKKRVETARMEIKHTRELWPQLCQIPGVNKRWLRAFAFKQIRQPPAAKFIAISEYLRRALK